ncbi:MAG: hypothetical protein WC436_04420 [Candidatus Babeliales bacterium]
MSALSEPITLLNIILCGTITVLGFFNYRKSNNLIPLFISIAFGLFGASHLITYVRFGVKIPIAIFLMRLAGYFFIIYILQAKLFNNNNNNNKE